MNENKFNVHYKDKKILVPGGAGFIGSNLTRKLVDHGALVTVVDPFSGFCGSNPFNLEGLEDRIILVKEKIEDFVDEARTLDYNIVFNCVGLTDHHIGLEKPSLDYEINCSSGLLLLDALDKKGDDIRMISLGSRSQYGKTDSLEVGETHPLSPLDVQAENKNLLEYFHKRFADDNGLDLTFIRLTNVYGARQRLKGKGIGVIGEIIGKSLAGEEMVVYGSMDRGKDILFVDDVVEALLLLGMQDKKTFKVYNMGGQWNKLALLIAHIRKTIKEANVKIVPFPERIKKIDTGDVELDIREIKRDIGWAPRTALGEGIRKTLEFYSRHREEYL